MRRRREKRTDYRQRLALLRSGMPRLVVRRGISNIRLQVIEFSEAGDKVVLELSSKSLRKHGWKGHCGSIPAAYLAGLAAGVEARKKGITAAIADIGLQDAIKGSSIFAAVLGFRDAGVAVPLGAIAPGQDRVSGKHVASYAEHLKKKDQDKYRKHFAAYLKAGLAPEKLPEHFEEIKAKILTHSEKKTVAVAQDGSHGDSDEEWEDG